MINSKKIVNFELSYPVDITNWNGEIISLKTETEIKKQIEILNEAGIKWCMLAGLQIEEALDFNIYQGAKKCGELFAAEALKISSHHCLLSTFAPLDTSQDEVKIKMKKNIDFCSLLQTEVLVIHPGRIAGKHKDGASINHVFEAEVNKHGIEKIIDTVADNFTTMGTYAADFGIKLAIENMGRFTPLGSIDVLPELLRKINLPNVGYCFDSGHAHAFGESMTEWINIAGDKLFATHLHDNKGKLANIELPGMFIESTKEYDEHSSPGFGTINWIALINSLRKVNYKFPVNFETGGRPDNDPRESYKQAIAWWRNCEQISYNKMKQD